ncbi:DUF84 family protein [Halosegnis longus]|uniref:inosine/xanthosine triphosphatase n=1 Tax=Halosegnis longus TaxID=2216012 RepID=A0AAJ4R9L0_9EURY|nr:MULTISPECIES: inosine/xanthosine triphosphatase [Halobacteriales]RNJ26681.1 DUF84 family protein [Salella cibi]
MHIAVGSGNPVKRDAVARAHDSATVEAVGVESGVSEQPVGIAETVEGAETRAANALAATDADLGVGLEGGVARLPDTDGLWLIMWAAATDGERWGRGSGPSLRLPDAITARVDAGEELGPVMDDVLNEDGVAESQGAAGALTGGVTNRTEALRTAVAGSLGPFLTAHY